MENHPIPQDITGFQFKLIGDMTIKQFAYLAAGIILGWIAFALPGILLIKLPITFVFIGLGIAAAFVPIEGRPFDVMISNYFKALFSPTQYIFQKTGGRMWFPEPQSQKQIAIQESHLMSSGDQSAQDLRDFLKTLPQKPQNKLDEKEMNFLKSLASIPSPTGVTPAPIADKPNVFQKIISHHQEPSDKVLHPKIDLDKTPQPEVKSYAQVESVDQTNQAQTTASLSSPSLQQVLSDASSHNQTMEHQVAELKSKMDIKNQKTFTPPIATNADIAPSSPMQPGKVSGFSFVHDVPNLIMGVIKDPRDNPLPNILVEVKDATGNPVRAFKTNVAGQFASATPLANGKYTLSFEDPKNLNKFSSTEAKADGNILTPMEITSLDSREELRRSLFNPPIHT